MLQVDKVHLVERGSSRRPQVGTLYLTASHTIFVDSEAEVRNETWVHHSLVRNVEKQNVTSLGYPLLIQCKNFQVIQLIIPQESDCNDVVMSLVRLSRAERYEELYCFSFKPNLDKTERDQAWNFIDLRAEYSRMGVPNKLWHLSPINREYRVIITQIFFSLNVTQMLYSVVCLYKCHIIYLFLSDLRSPSMGEFLSGLENSDWLKHIQTILNAGKFIAKAVAEEGVSVLVHCSDGWDRTAQVCSVASVLLDPFYRTLKGLMVLIEKDWVSFGHKFSHRYSHLDEDPKEVSPVIDQFLECVWQLMEQFPCAFEYNERFLISIHNHVHSCHYGNFISNCEKERKDLGIKEKTHSVWPHLWTNKSDFMNPLFRTDHSQTQGVLRPLTTPYCFKFWRGLYNRFDRGLHPRQSVLDCLMAVKEETQQLEELLADCEQKLAALGKEQVNGVCVNKRTVNQSRALWAQPAHISLANTPQDYNEGILGSSPKDWSLQQKETESTGLGLFGVTPKTSDPDNSDQESSSGGDSFPSEDSVKDADLDEAV
uniref:Myotubularin related protein 7a n=1 Tax=Astyanax mexicanus TaxID=7994 RepID=A0A8B9LFM5_ASTMX